MLVLVAYAAESVASSYVKVKDPGRVVDRLGQRAERAVVADALVGPMRVVEVFELAQSMEQMALVPSATGAAAPPGTPGRPHRTAVYAGPVAAPAP
ncbi:hypothetical protein ABZ876_30765 [Streptomyces sp. NPDC046931]|uniref:hypothetical protein n=1 Tax=Streptomyces sp. NPDC046931 TaxID=3154806 RepID=UPI0033CFB74B